MTRLTVNNSPYGKAAVLTHAVVGFSTQDSTIITQGENVSLEHPGLPHVSEPNNVLRTLARIKNASSLTGSTPSDISHVEQWLSFTRTQLSTSMTPEHLHLINHTLQNSTYLAGHRLTLADLTVYIHVASQVARLAPAQRTEYRNLIRWFDHIQHLPATRATKPVELVEIKQAPSPIYLIDTYLPESKPKAIQPPTEKVHKVDKALHGAKSDEKTATPTPNGVAKPKDEKKPNGAAPAPAAAAAPAKADGKKDAKPAKPAAAKDEKKDEDASSASNQIYRADIRVGKILSVKRHPTKEKLYVQQIEIGESAPRTVVSGLAEYYKPEQLQGQLVVLMVNVKAGDMDGVESNGRVLVATSQDGKTKEIAQPPAGVKIGERITFKDTPLDKADNPIAPKNLHKIMKDLHTNDNKIVQYQSLNFTSSAGPISVPTVVNGTVA